MQNQALLLPAEYFLLRGTIAIQTSILLLLSLHMQKFIYL